VTGHRHEPAPTQSRGTTGFKRILLVEDNPYDVELALAALEEHRLATQVAVTRDGVEALDYLHGRGRYSHRSGGLPVVMFVDVKLPRMDGLELLGHLKRDPDLRHVPVVMLTSSRESRDLERCYDLGANAYVVKPVDFAQYVTTVKEIGLFWAVLNEPPPGTTGYTA